MLFPTQPETFLGKSRAGEDVRHSCKGTIVQLLMKRRSFPTYLSRSLLLTLLVVLLILFPFLDTSLAEEKGVWIEPHTSMRFVLIPAGEFTMGSPVEEPEREEAEKEHLVKIDSPFYLGQYEVTQKQWRLVMESNPSWFSKCGPECPVESVSHLQIVEFMDRLNQLTGEVFRLPSEEEWEYACRAGSETPFNTGENLTTDQANYDGRYPYAGHPEGEYRGSPSPVGLFPPNQWGLYDMHGNVWEWTGDWYYPELDQSEKGQTPDYDPELKVIRGGSWYFGADSARCALRYTHRPQDDGFSLGFRLLRESGEKKNRP